MTDKFNIDIKHKVLLEIPHLSKMNFTYLLMTLLLLSKYIFLCIILFAFYKFFSFFGLLHYLIIFIFIISPLNFLFTRYLLDLMRNLLKVKNKSLLKLIGRYAKFLQQLLRLVFLER